MILTRTEKIDYLLDKHYFVSAIRVYEGMEDNEYEDQFAVLTKITGAIEQADTDNKLHEGVLSTYLQDWLNQAKVWIEEEFELRHDIMDAMRIEREEAEYQREKSVAELLGL